MDTISAVVHPPRSIVERPMNIIQIKWRMKLRYLPYCLNLVQLDLSILDVKFSLKITIIKLKKYIDGINA